MKRSRNFISVANLPKLCEGVEAGLRHKLSCKDLKEVVGFYRNVFVSQAIPQVARQSAIVGLRGIARVSLGDKSIDQLELSHDDVGRSQGISLTKRVYIYFAMKGSIWILIKVRVMYGK